MAHRLTNNGSDQDALLALLDAVAENTGQMPDEVSADNGFCSEANLEGLIARTVRGYVAAGRASRPDGGKKGGKLVQAMRARIRQGGHRSRYRMRKYTSNPYSDTLNRPAASANSSSAASIRSEPNGP